MRFAPEPSPRPQPARAAILLVNLGTPAAATASAVRSYLREFLSDPRVVEIPPALWWPILNGPILLTRPAKSAAKYAKVWSDEGSPLAVHTARQAKLVQGYLHQAGLAGQVVVDWAMRYGKPALPDVLARLKQQGCDRILVVPLYPQYAASTTASVFDAVGATLRTWRHVPELRTVRSFHDDPRYIAALAASVRAHWQKNGQGERLLMSFHGIPKRSIELGDPYEDECRQTGRLLARELGLDDTQWVLTFQSRFGRAAWLQPYTEPTLIQLAQQGVRHVDVMCPGFVADCLETLEEINMECRAAFLGAGGREFQYIPCLNEEHPWLSALVHLIRRHAHDWLGEPVVKKKPPTPI